jgi:serine/threonine-protein kinase OSR1/STK39
MAERARERAPAADAAPASAFPLEHSQYQLLHIVGRGDLRGSEVWAARCLVNDRTVAARLIDLDLCPLDLDQLRTETAFWSSCDHPNAIRYYGSFLAGSVLWCLMEYADGGSLSDVLRWVHPRGIGDEAVIATVLHGLLTFLAYFHGRKQLHRAVCTNNVLLTMQGEVKVGDLGSATGMIRAGQRYRACFTVMESPYSAPEGMVEGHGYTEKSDIWSVGITAITLATGQTPFAAMKPLEQMQAIVSGPSPELAGGAFSSQLRDFVRLCLQRDAERRPAAAVLLRHAFLRRARGPEFLATAVMINLPPLAHRFEVESPGQAHPALARAHPRISFDFGQGEAAAPPPTRPPPDPAPPKQIGRFTVKVVPHRAVEEEQKSALVETVRTDVMDLSTEAKALERQGMELAELLRETQESIQRLADQQSSNA